MDLKDLRYFRTIAECGTLSKAAAQLRIAQPALSRKLQKLEHDLGVQLFRRTLKGVSVTDAGCVLLGRVAEFEQTFSEMRRDMARYAEEVSGVLRVAIQSPLSLVMVPDLVREYQAACPGVTLQLTEGFSGDLIDALLDERIDLAVADTPSHLHANLNYAQLWIETLQLVGPAGGLIGTRFGAGPVPLQDIAALPVIMPGQRHGIRRLVDAAFERQQLRFAPVMEANGALMILQLVKSGFGYTLMPSNGVFPWVESGELESASVRPDIRRTMSVITQTSLLDDPRVVPLREIVIRLSPAIASKKRFGPAALFLGERTTKPVRA